MTPHQQTICLGVRACGRIMGVLLHHQRAETGLQLRVTRGIHTLSSASSLNRAISIVSRQRRWLSSSKGSKGDKDESVKIDSSEGAEKDKDAVKLDNDGEKSPFPDKFVATDAGPNGTGLVLAERGPGEVVLSALQGLLSFVDSESRKKFVDRSNKGIINPTALGIPLSLALHHELNCVLWEKYKFDIMEFGEGVPGALQFFHDTDAQFHKEIHDKVKGMDLSHIKSDSLTEDEEGSNELSSPFSVLKAVWNPLKFMETAYKVTKDLAKLAESQPDSAAATFQRLTTPFLFERHCFISAEGHLIAELDKTIKNLPEFWTNKLIIENVTLLSARAKAIEPNPATPEEYEKMNDAEKQRNDDLIQNIYHEYPCVAQIEVLYNYKYDTGKTAEKDTTNSSSSAEANGNKENTISTEGNKAGEDILTNRLQKEFLAQQRSVRVVFTGWLFGSPDGKGLEWKVGALTPS